MSRTGSASIDKAFCLGQGEGHIANSLPELLAYVIELLQKIRDENAMPDINPLNLEGRVLEDRAYATCLTSGPYAWWFRGVPTDRHRLLSKVFRRFDGKLSEDKRRGQSRMNEFNYPSKVMDAPDLSRRLQHEYSRETRRHSGEGAWNWNVWDCLSEMQHYGMPTRLLDWSYSLTTAAFFAVYYARKDAEDECALRANEECALSRPKPDSGHPTIWILNPRVLSGVYLGEYALNDYAYLEINGSHDEVANKWKHLKFKRGEEQFGRPNWIYRKLIENEGHFPLPASWTNSRLAAQSCCFTLQGCAEPLDKLAQQQFSRKKPLYLLKVRLHRKGVEQAWDQLQSIGIDKRYLFPEKDKIAESIIEHRRI